RRPHSLGRHRLPKTDYIEEERCSEPGVLAPAAIYMKNIPLRSLAGRVFRSATVLTAVAIVAQPLALSARPATTRLQPGPIKPSATVRPNVPAGPPVEEG